MGVNLFEFGLTKDARNNYHNCPLNNYKRHNGRREYGMTIESNKREQKMTSRKYYNVALFDKFVFMIANYSSLLQGKQQVLYTLHYSYLGILRQVEAK